MGLRQELITILWKNFIIRRRHWILTITEILIPILLFLLLTYGRSKVPDLTKVEVGAKFNDPIHEEFIYGEFAINDLHLWYAPRTNFTDKIIEQLIERFQLHGDVVQHFDSEHELLQQGIENENAAIVAIIFDVNSPHHLKYDLRIYEKFLMWETKKLFSSVPEALHTMVSSPYLHRFAALQIAINRAFIEMNAKNRDFDVRISIQEFPYPPAEADLGITQLLMNFMPLITILSFIFLCSSVLKRVIEEKTSGIKEYMKMVGMKQWMMYVGWILYAFTSNLISIIVIVYLVKTPLWNVKFPLIEYTSGTMFFVFLLLYCLAAVAMCFFIASFWNNPSIGMLFGVIFWILSYFVPIYINQHSDSYSKAFKILLALFPNMGLYYGFSAMQLYETRKIGLQWNNFCLAGNGSAKDITMLNVFVIFILEFFVLILLANYIDNIRPGEYGIAKPINYPLKSLWKFLNRKSQTNCQSLGASLSDNEMGRMLNIESGTGKVPCVQLNHLSKRYGPINAVDNLNWTIYKDQITILLGQNGAGKTTTMSMLTGMIDATSGSIEYNCKNLKDNIDEIRLNLGLCPQENLLFPDLTVFEHLKFFSMLKGRNCGEAAGEAKKVLEKIGLEAKANCLAHTLSGGMKRKLCLGMALMGDPTVLILDEPTSGMDPETREKICNMLLEVRKSKTILISTHHMDDAEMLGDWIAIMANGKLQCYGTPMYLKEQYNTGYHLSVTLSNKKYREDVKKSLRLSEPCTEQGNQLIYQFANIVDAQEKFNEFKDLYNVKMNGKSLIFNVDVEDDLETCISFNMPSAKKLNPIGDTQIYLLRTVEKDEYKGLLKCLEEKFSSAKISLTITTLDTVLESVRAEISEVDTSKSDIKATQIECKTSSNKFSALFRKRLYFIRRKIFLYVPAIVALFASFMFGILMARGSTESAGYDGPTLNLIMNPYGPTTVYYSDYGGKSDRLLNTETIYDELVKQQLGETIKVDNVSIAILNEGIKNIEFYKKHLVIAAEFYQSNNEMSVNAMYSSVALHSLPISINLAMNSMAKNFLGPEYEISTSVTPLKLASTQVSPSELSMVQIATLWVIFIPMGMLMFISCFVIFPHFEIESSFFELQQMTGVGPGLYWLVNFVFDFLISLACIGFISTIFWTFEGATIYSYGALLLILLAFAIYSLPFAYAMSFKSKTLTSGISRIVTFGMLLGIVPTIVVLIMESSGMEVYEYWGGVIKYVLLAIAPPFSLTYITARFTQTCITNYNWLVMLPTKRQYLCRTDYADNPCCSGTCEQFTNYLNGDYGFGCELIVSFLTVVMFFLIVEWKIILKLWRRARNLNASVKKNQQENLVVEKLKKSKRVEDVTFKVSENECFGLLGVNGAGKTTTFKILTKKESKDDGNVQIKSSTGEVKNLNDDEYLEQFGYCPQIDSLNYALSANELIETMAMLRGFSHEKAQEVSKSFIKLFGLESYRDKPCMTYSGGNKRKLSTCLAFVSSPKVILLDEPTSGVDPVSRHQFWDVLKGFKCSKKSSFILCSHSMDECEALCDTIAIMKAGTIHATGSLPELKNKYAKGYKIQLKLKKESKPDDSVDAVDGMVENGVEKLKKRFEEVFGKENCLLKDEHPGQLYYEIKKIDRLSATFEAMDDLKSQFNFVENYTITDNTLKDILINIANNKEKVE